MQSYISDLIPRVSRYSKKLDILTALVDKEWVLFDVNQSEQRIYIFKRNNELLIIHNAIVTKSKWELIGTNSLTIDINGQSILLLNGFLDESILALKLHNNMEYFIFINKFSFRKEITSLVQINKIFELKLEKFDKPKYKINYIGIYIFGIFLILLALLIKFSF